MDFPWVFLGGCPKGTTYRGPMMSRDSHWDDFPWAIPSSNKAPSRSALRRFSSNLRSGAGSPAQVIWGNMDLLKPRYNQHVYSCEITSGKPFIEVSIRGIAPGKINGWIPQKSCEGGRVRHDVRLKHWLIFARFNMFIFRSSKDLITKTPPEILRKKNGYPKNNGPLKNVVSGFKKGNFLGMGIYVKFQGGGRVAWKKNPIPFGDRKFGALLAINFELIPVSCTPEDYRLKHNHGGLVQIILLSKWVICRLFFHQPPNI